MSDDPIFLSGSAEVVSTKDGDSSFLAPGLKAEIQVYSGEGFLSHERFILSRNIAYAGTKMLFDALAENECRVRKTVIISGAVPANPDAAPHPPGIIRFRSAARRGMGSFIRVVHEQGHVTWHLPVNRIWQSAALTSFHASAWEFDIPHVEPSGGKTGIFGPVGHKVVTEVAFRFLEKGSAELVELFAGKMQKRRGLGLKRFVPDRPERPFEDFEMPGDVDGKKRILLLLHGTFSSINGCFGELIRDRFFAQLSRKYAYVLGLEHDTLTVPPDTNAHELNDLLRFERLRRNYAVDIIAHSRGGLVARWLAESIVCNSPFYGGRSCAIKRVVMFGTPNSGTPVAQNLLNMINVVGNSTGYIPDEGMRNFLYAVISVIRLIGHGVERLPGIEAQSPNSEFLRDLNGPNDSGAIQYSVASSQYKPEKYLYRLLTAACGYALFNGEPNDLVVPASSVSACVPTQTFNNAWRYAGPEIHHCSFFGNARTKRFLKQALLS